MYNIKRQLTIFLSILIIFLSGCESCSDTQNQNQNRNQTNQVLTAQHQSIKNDPNSLWLMKEETALKSLKEICLVDPSFCLKKDQDGDLLLTNALMNKKELIAGFLVDEVKKNKPSLLTELDSEGRSPLYYVYLNGTSTFVKDQIAKLTPELLKKNAFNESPLLNIIFGSALKYASEYVEVICKKFPEICNNESFISNVVLDSSASDATKVYLLKHKPFLFTQKDDKGNNILHKEFNSLLINMFFKDHEEFVKTLLDKSSLDLLLEKNNEGKSAFDNVIDQDYQNIFLQIIKKYPNLLNYKKGPASQHAYIYSHEEPKTLLALAKENKLPENITKAINELQTQPMVSSVNSEFLEVSLDANKNAQVQIKKSVNSDELIHADGSTQACAINLLSYDDLLKSSYLLTPQSNPINLFADTYKNLGINIPRPNILGFSISKLKEERNTIAYKIDGALSDAERKELSDDVFNKHFATLEDPKNKIAQGIFKLDDHTVVKISPDKNGLYKEYSNLEKLASTNAVIKALGYFEHGDKAYLLMEKGEKSLADIIKNKEDISLDLLIKAAYDLEVLNGALSSLNIKLEDIKPGNLLLTADGIKAIDLDVTSNRYTLGYSSSGASRGQLFARSLLEVFLKKTILFAYSLRLDRYFDYDHGYSSAKIASDEYVSYLNKYYCERVLGQSDCSKVSQYNYYRGEWDKVIKHGYKVFPYIFETEVKPKSKELYDALMKLYESK